MAENMRNAIIGEGILTSSGQLYVLSTTTTTTKNLKKV